MVVASVCYILPQTSTYVNIETEHLSVYPLAIR